MLSRPKTLTIQPRRHGQISGRKVGGESERQSLLRRQLRAEVARSQQGDRYLTALPRKCPDGLAGLLGAEIVPELLKERGEIIAGLRRDAAQCAHGVIVAAGSSSQAEINTPGIKRVQSAELLGDYKGRMIRKHDSPAADPDRTRRVRNVVYEDGGGGTGETGDSMMFSQPETPVAPFLDVPRQIYRAPDGGSDALSGVQTDKIENGNRQREAHGRSDEPRGRKVTNLCNGIAASCAADEIPTSRCVHRNDPDLVFSTAGCERFGALYADAVPMDSLDRRLFLMGVAAGGAGGAGGAQDERSGDMIYRPLGSTGQKVSVIGLGGSHIGKADGEPEAVRIIRSAIDRGLTFMDNSWDYNDGNGEAEKRMGRALRDGYRQKCFLMTKVDGRTKEAAARQIDESLHRLQTDRVDLMQFHEVIRMEDPDRFFSDHGAVHAFLDAKKAGKIRYIGFTGHKDPSIHLRMLEQARSHGFRFDTIMFPNNVMDAHFRSFGKNVLPEAQKENMGILCMKPLAGGYVMKSKTVSAIEALHFVLNQPVSVCINGCQTMKDLDQAFEATRTFRPMSEQQVNALLAKTRDAAQAGHFEPFKTDVVFDSTAKHPEWLG